LHHGLAILLLRNIAGHIQLRNIDHSIELQAKLPDHVMACIVFKTVVMLTACQHRRWTCLDPVFGVTNELYID
jgi:hypothetical protein